MEYCFNCKKLQPIQVKKYTLDENKIYITTQIVVTCDVCKFYIRSSQEHRPKIT